MGKDWEVYSIKDLGKVITGSTPSTKDDLNYSSNDYSFVKPSDIPQNQILYIDNTECYVSEYAFKNSSRILPSGTVLITCIGIIGKVGITKNDCICNQQINAIIPNDKVNNKFLAYSIFAKREVLSLIANAPVVPIINKNDFSNIKLQIPTLQIQQQIVGELDSITSIIEKHKKQLEELDTLAQSLFYTMFGDPITNEKGWETKSIDKICVSKKEIKRASSVFSKDDRIIYIDISSIDNVNNIIMSPTIYNFGEAPSRAQQVVQKGDILISLVRPNLNNVSLITTANPNLVASSGFCVLRATNEINTQYLFFFVKMDHCREYLMQRVAGANYPAIKTEDIMRYKISLPPLALQQQFAEKIEAIEQQKERIRQSLAEVQLLFDSRMDYYFNN